MFLQLLCKSLHKTETHSKQFEIIAFFCSVKTPLLWRAHIPGHIPWWRTVGYYSPACNVKIFSQSTSAKSGEVKHVKKCGEQLHILFLKCIHSSTAEMYQASVAGKPAQLVRFCFRLLHRSPDMLPPPMLCSAMLPECRYTQYIILAQVLRPTL